ncbi:MAG: hypothetical protein WC781_02515 [Candidatus Pacearchaeota archaeon]|jgi:hypothetical protein
MGFFKKSSEKKEDMSKLPGLPPLPEESIKTTYPPEKAFQPEQRKNFTLPSFPDSNFGQKMNQETIKGAITEKNNEEKPIGGYIPPQKAKTQEISDIKSVRSLQPSEFEMREMKPRTMEISDWSQNKPQQSEWVPSRLQKSQQMPIQKYETQREFQKIKKAEPLFIKLEKFESTISTFNEIKMKISEIESLLRNIREIKLKEEKELSDWEKEIEMIKARLDQIDREVFKI